MKLRPYQIKAINQIISQWKDYKKLLIVLPTGTGKTIVFSKIIDILVSNNKRCLVLAHRDELIRQAQDKLKQFMDIDVAIEKASETAEGSYHPVTIGSVQTLMRQKRLARFAQDHYDVVIVDEAHHAISDSYQAIFKYFSDARVLGVTATPERGDKQNLGKFFDNLAYEYSMKDAVADGYLVPIVAQTIPIDIDLSKVSSTAGDYKASDLDCAIEPYLQKIGDAMAGHAKARKCVVFLPLIKTSIAFEKILADRGFNACHIDGTSTDRKEILEAFHENKYNVLCNSMLLTEGWDQPDVDCIVVLRPTRSRSLYQQMVGRGSRIFPGKQDLLLLDFLWHSEKHSLCHPAHIVAETEEIAAKMIEMSKSGKRASIQDVERSAHKAVSTEREAALSRYIDENAKRKAKTIDPLAFGTLTHCEDITDYTPVFGWEKTEATEGQKEALAKYGFDGSKMTKGYANKILDVVIGRSQSGLATPKQMNVLQRYGYRNFDNMTFQQASEKIDKIAKNGWKHPYLTMKKFR